MDVRRKEEIGYSKFITSIIKKRSTKGYKSGPCLVAPSISQVKHLSKFNECYGEIIHKNSINKFIYYVRKYAEKPLCKYYIQILEQLNYYFISFVTTTFVTFQKFKKYYLF